MMHAQQPQVVAPKRAALAEANRKLEAANKKLAGIRAKVKELQDKVAALEESFVKATEDKNAAIAQVGTTDHCCTPAQGQAGRGGLKLERQMFVGNLLPAPVQLWAC